MLSPARRRLAFVRLCLVFIALCLVLAHLEVAKRLLDDQSVGLPNALLGRDPLPPPSDLPFLGITIDTATLAPSDQAALFEQLAATGFGWVRLRVAWDRIEPVPHHDEWEDLDRTLNALAAAHLIPVLLLDGSPTWTRARNDQRSPAGKFAPPADLAAFAGFAQAVATRYGNQVRYYQIWDEPNIAPHWGERHIEAVDYGRMLKAAATVIRAADADAYILLAALAPTADRGHLAQDESYFLNRLYATGTAPYFDAVAIQPFGFASTPDSIRVDGNDLDFRRTLLIRQTMLDAGDGTTPIWLMRFGWNRAPASNWQSVSAAQQRDFTLRALEIAYRQWPWVAGMGWPAAQLPANDPAAGFALTPELNETFHTAATTLLAEPRPLHTPTPPLALWTPVLLWSLAALLLLWRGAVAARQLPWQKWQERWLALPRWQRACCWALLLLLYHLAVWPPLLLLYAFLAALGFLAEPRLGLALALLVLPVYDYHKEFDWLGYHWLLPPTQAVLLCLMPAIWRYRPKKLPRHCWRDPWNGVAVAWLVLTLLSATGVWYWPAYGVGLLNLAITPLLLFCLIRTWATTTEQARSLLVTLATGGLLIALVGLFDWLQGRGTLSDGMLRLKGLGYSSNHTALYLIRTLAIMVGLTLAAQGRSKWVWGLWTSVVTAALLLTGSRGALLLGIPAGALFLLSRRNLRLPSRRISLIVVSVAVVGLAALAWLWRTRFGDVGTMLARMDGWVVADELWYEHFLFGVGPDGFWWSFPAKMWLSSDADPNLRHPHIIWLELVTSGGLAALLWLIAVAVLLYRWVRARRHTLSWLQIGIVTAFIAGFAHAQVDAFQALPELAGWNWAALALLLALDRQPEKVEEAGEAEDISPRAAETQRVPATAA